VKHKSLKDVAIALPILDDKDVSNFCDNFVNSGGASAVKEPGHFEVRKSSSQVTRMHFFPRKS